MAERHSGNYRSSSPEVFCKRGVLRNFAKFIGKHLHQSLFFNIGLRPATILKKRLWHRCFPVNFAKFLRTPFLTEYRWWLLLKLMLLINNSSINSPMLFIFETSRLVLLKKEEFELLNYYKSGICSCIKTRYDIAISVYLSGIFLFTVKVRK